VDRDGDDDPLAVDQEIGEVVGEEVADGDREQAGRGRRDADEARHHERGTHDEGHEPSQDEGLRQRGREPKLIDPDLGL
jgi:hypothetical protein